MILFINTALEREIVALIKNGKIIKQIDFQRKFRKAERLLSLVDQLLKNSSLRLKELKGIMVVRGPGAGFTSLRVGITIANTLAYCLNIPIKGIKLNKLNKRDLFLSRTYRRFSRPVLPFYGREPSITVK